MGSDASRGLLSPFLLLPVLLSEWAAREGVGGGADAKRLVSSLIHPDVGGVYI
jgi:hypothetical protein